MDDVTPFDSINGYRTAMDAMNAALYGSVCRTTNKDPPEIVPSADVGDIARNEFEPYLFFKKSRADPPQQELI